MRVSWRGVRRSWLFCTAAALFFAASTARAQPAPPGPPAPPAPKAPAIEMPRPLSPLTARYPEGAEGDAVVIVKLVVEKDGSVSKAEVAEGKEPFSSAAVAAARGFQFVPAKQDGAPMRAAIRVEVKFAAPAPVTEPGSGQAGGAQTASPQAASPRSDGTQAVPSPPGGAPAATSPAGDSPPPPPEPLDVSVRGLVAPAGATSMSRAEVRLLPGAFGDPFRAVETLPGITPLASGIPYFFVRGAPPGNVGYFLDGIRVPLLFHLGLGPSVIHPALVDRVDLYPGGYPARFGRFAGAIISGETRGPRPEVNAEAQLRLVDAGAMIETPFDGGRGSAMVGGRYSYTGLLFSILQQDLKLDYWDYQARVSYDIGPSETVTLFAFGARDFLGDKDQLDDADPRTFEQRTLVDTMFHRVDLRYERRLGPDSHFRHAFTFGWDETAFDGGGTRDALFSARSELRLSPSPMWTFRGGTDVTFDVVETSLSSAQVGGNNVGDDIPIALSNRRDLYAAVWADAVFKPTERFEITPGVRVDLYGSTGQDGGAAIAVEPRISSILHVSPWLRLVQAHGVATQRPSFLVAGPGFTPDFQGGVLQKSFQSSAGVEMDMPLDIEGKLVVFRNAFFDMTDAFGTAGTLTDFGTPDSYSPARSLGSSIGAELSFRRRMTKRIGGFFSYTLSHSDRATGTERFTSSTNRTHVLNLALGADLFRGLRAGVRVVFYTGYPETGRAPQVGAPLLRTGRDLPPFFRLDQRLEKRWTLGGTRWLSLVLEMQNSTLSTETLGVRCQALTCRPVVVGPIAIPSIGLEGGL